MTAPAPYIGRFAPSPTGPLHAGSLVAALASWLDARAHGGRWLVRIEDIDPPRCQPGADRWILQQLDQCGLRPDAEPLWQSQRHPHYAQALQQLVQAGACYPCICTRKAIAAALLARGVDRTRHQMAVYPGTCRPPRAVPPPAPLSAFDAPGVAWRLRTDVFPPNGGKASAQWTDTAINSGATSLRWHDRRLGPQTQDVAAEVGDFVLKRADGLWAYQLAVVVDDALQGVTHIVRGEDLADNTARQILLQRWLGAAPPAYLHTPLVRDASGEKLSKQHGAPPLRADTPAEARAALAAAAQALDLPDSPALETAAALADWTAAWARRHGPRALGASSHPLQCGPHPSSSSPA